jgi:cell division protein FtsB
MFRELQTIKTSAAVIITRPPEIIACVKLVINDRDVFIIFDSHSRPSYPNGAGFILDTSLHRTATRLSEILPVDNLFLSDGGLQWQAQLLANYSGHIFLPRGTDNDPAHLMQSIIESSLAILALRAEVSALTSQNSTITSECKRLEAEMEQMEDDHREELSRIRRSSIWQQSSSHPMEPISAQIGNNLANFAAPQALLYHSGRPLAGSYIDENSWSSVVLSSADEHQNKLPNPEASGVTLAERLQGEWLNPGQRDIEAAVERQRQYDQEDRVLRAQMEELARNMQRQFQCGICFDELLEDFVTRLEPCEHCFCRDCIRGYVGCKIDEHRYPILCPICMTEKRAGDPGGTLAYFILEHPFVLMIQFSGHERARSTDRYLSRAVCDLGGAGVGGVLGPVALPQVSTIYFKFIFVCQIT